MSDDKKNNVEYFPGKPGFYKKGPGQFKISFGSLDDLVDEDEEQIAKDEEEKRLKVVPREDVA